MSKKLKHKVRRSRDHLDYHHILYQKKHWSVGYAKLLREHPYLGEYIPQNTLHRTIHSKIHDIPVPNGKICKMTYYKLLNMEAQGLIDVQYDTLEQRIDFLIKTWEPYCPATVAILKWQQDIARKFYERREEVEDWTLSDWH